MIKIPHRIFLSVLLAMNVFATSTFYFIYTDVVAAELSKQTLTLVNISFGLFVSMLWVHFAVTLFYAKNNDSVLDL
jgi:hypothetical protein